ncbi:MAG: hypothetical protein BWY28_00029 [bacterium ADurb.Bin236]|nr:MAG: hypothetical protein BWY28_00029 [bacterium ADurb.Bin236]HPN93160.1 isopeptide-forming domain-containing fimbrial protein [bacterium]
MRNATKIRNGKKKRFLEALLFLLAAAGIVAAAAKLYAVGTASGTIISNQAYVDYKDANNNSMTRVYSNTVTTTVSQVAAVSLVPPSGTMAGANNTTIMHFFQIFNDGNGSDKFDFTYAVGGAWTPSSITFYYDINNNHTYDAGTDTLMTAVAGKYTTGTVVADDDYDVFMFVTIPASGAATDGTSNTITITATSQFDPGQTTTGLYTTTVAAAVINAAKTHSPESPAPGDTVTYTITMSNTGSSAGTSVVMTDVVPTGVTYVPGSITLDGTTKTDATGDDGSDYNGTTGGAVTVTVGTINAGSTKAVTFQATVNSGVAYNSTITNQASVAYVSGPNNVTTYSNGRTLFVGALASVDLTVTITALSGDPSDKITYPFTVHNYTNSNDVIDLTYTSSQGWTWVFWADMNNDGISGNDGDYLLTDTDADGKVDTGTLAQNGTISVLAVVTIPAGASDQSIDTLAVTGKSSVDTSKSDILTFTTTVTAPVVTLTKSVSPTGTQPPGTTLTYTITATNSGTGVATVVVITDHIPLHTTYVPGSLYTGATTGTLVSRTDASDGDGATYDSGSNNALGETPSLGAGGTYVLRFSVTIN